ncbi:ATP-binding protein [Paenibacillus allorhizosphaerae]|uniref:histidine kinase n=1 Tax=Paenibacillus allorhizosphaerae TaxID=2849866 RepID=A0ABM8VTB7_9BACL|nr:HAMP domain-containing sensor histidine kinase [Paenibacillus allorhizosphaerae]CAG7657451.1 Sensor histidine kinase RcsC [Paenibacillus allorhizosphaerae]
MMQRPRSLRFQLLSRSLLILSVLLLMIGVFQYVIMAQFLYKNKASTIQAQIRTVPFPFWQQAATSPEKIDFRNPVSSLRAGGSTVAFLDADNRFQVLIQDPEQTAAVPRLPDQDYKEAMHPQSAPDYRIVKDEQGTKQLVVLRPINARDRLIGIVQVSSKLEPLQSIVVGQLLTYAGLSVLALAAGLLTFLPILRRTLIPLSRMTDTVEKINAGNLDERLPIRHEQVEIDRLSMSFNAMLERLEHSFAAEKQAQEQMRRFIADASHELRTPLTSIHGFLEVLLRGAAADPEQLRNALKSMYGESKRLNGLAEELLMLARLDQAPVLQQSEGRLSELLREMEHQLQLFAGERNVVFQIATEQTSRFDRNRMKQVVLNLVQNAVQHTDPNAGHIAISLEKQGDAMVFIVEDNGTGFAEEHTARLFDRFYRVDTARSRKQGGAGLGLSITKSIVELHGGSITATGKPGMGARFAVRLPIA